MRFAHTTAAVHWFCIAADMYVPQTFIGVISVSQGWYQPILQSGLEQWGMGFAKNSATVH